MTRDLRPPRTLDAGIRCWLQSSPKRVSRPPSFPPPLLSLERKLHVLVVAGLVAVAGCSASQSAPSRLPPGAVVLPYDAQGAYLFGDAIEPNAVGLLTSPSFQARQLLAERTRQAHVVTRVRVQTVTSDIIHGEPRYQLTVTEIGPPFGSAGLPGGRAELDVGPQSPAFGIVKAHDARLVGKSFIGFFRWFRGGEEPQLHWHLTSDDPETAAAIREAALTSED